jgi:hypothetical protein
MTAHRPIPVEVGFVDFLFKKRDILRAQAAGRDDPELRKKLVFFDDLLANRERPALAAIKPSPSRD